MLTPSVWSDVSFSTLGRSPIAACRPMLPKPNFVCPACGGPNDCSPARSGTFDAPCWCSEITVHAAAIAHLPEHQRNRSCLCRQCAAISRLEDHAH
ncbi:MAG: cysteine-rich CWC family protein [Casimicrobiaceae bacterium]